MSLHPVVDDIRDAALQLVQVVQVMPQHDSEAYENDLRQHLAVNDW